MVLLHRDFKLWLRRQPFANSDSGSDLLLNLAPALSKFWLWHKNTETITLQLTIIFFYSNGHGHSHDGGSHGHAHDHGHGHDEPPAFKWSKQVPCKLYKTSSTKGAWKCDIPFNENMADRQTHGPPNRPTDGHEVS